MSQKYRFRYRVEPGAFTPPKTTRVRPNVHVSHTDDGFADDLFIVSLLHCEHGKIDGDNVLFLSTLSPADNDGGCSFEDLKLLRDLVNAEIERRESK